LNNKPFFPLFFGEKSLSNNKGCWILIFSGQNYGKRLMLRIISIFIKWRLKDDDGN